MRSLSLLMVAILPFATLTATAGAQDTTAKAQPTHTMWGALGLKGAQIAFGGGTVPYQGRGAGGASESAAASATEFRLGLTFAKLPDWTLTLASNAVTNPDSTAYVPDGSLNNYHPELHSQSIGVEVQRRWNSHAVVHPLATIGIGHETSFFYYVRCLNDNCVVHEDQKTTVGYASATAGGELNITSWFRFSLVAGYRGAKQHQLTVGGGTNSGILVTSLFELGKF